MKKYFRPLLWILLSICAFSACEENMEKDEEFVDWQEKNTAAFRKVMDHANQAIAKSKADFNTEWEDHCDWRTFLTYTQVAGVSGKATDSICVKIERRGQGHGSPLYTDSVAVNYLGRLIPSPSYPDGYVFDHSSKGGPVDDVFNPDYAVPAKFLVSNNIVGFTTALQNMHIGDLWTIYIPSELAYGKVTNRVIPGYSMLIFQLELKAYSRAGFPLEQ